MRSDGELHCRRRARRRRRAAPELPGGGATRDRPRGVGFRARRRGDDGGALVPDRDRRRDVHGTGARYRRQARRPDAAQPPAARRHGGGVAPSVRHALRVLFADGADGEHVRRRGRDSLPRRGSAAGPDRHAHHARPSSSVGSSRCSIRRTWAAEARPGLPQRPHLSRCWSDPAGRGTWCCRRRSSSTTIRRSRRRAPATCSTRPRSTRSCRCAS